MPSDETEEKKEEKKQESSKSMLYHYEDWYGLFIYGMMNRMKIQVTQRDDCFVIHTHGDARVIVDDRKIPIHVGNKMKVIE